MKGTGHAHPCTDRLALCWAGVIALAAMGVGATLTWASIKMAEGKVSEGVLILLFGVPNNVVSMIAGYIGGRASQQINAQSANVTGGGTPSAAHVENQTVTTTTQPTPAAEGEMGG